MSKQNRRDFLKMAGAATAATLTGNVLASDNPFGFKEMAGGYQQVAEGKCGGRKEPEGKCGEGKCGEGKCGGQPQKYPEGKCGEGKCGEGKCGGQPKQPKPAMEGKCGEGKCGGMK
ncbi:hypothetical protein AVO42_12185 [Thiomicrospira sp. XS5]|uniref:HvfA family oxazolone/thioamide-modified RiPP metallophore n=1 Tax=Thiomicrospira sp. XS5 TaxID=1775636 RepID=UPI000749D6E7|nr:twin-arginine translocation signal domain-containing protein [Thiomicrospira sp. XS5]KUJ73568.1 hypothetical protein AVO42_12185 [Thiomicrospira sp. XS5]